MLSGLLSRCRTVLAMAAMAVALVPPSYAAPSGKDLPFFTAFKTFCIDTGADYVAIQAAVERAGGTVYAAPDDSTVLALRNSAVPPRIGMWRIVWHNQRLEVQASTFWPNLKPPAPAKDKAILSDCKVRSATRESASVNAISAWAGVPPQPRSLQDVKLYPDSRSFDFQMVGNVHMAVANETQRRQAITEGRHWGLFVYMNGGSTDVALSRELPESAALLAAARADQPVITNPTDISHDAAIQIGMNACGRGLGMLGDKAWRARREGAEWRVWISSPTEADPDDDSTYVFYQVWIEAKSGKVRTCIGRTE